MINFNYITFQTVSVIVACFDCLIDYLHFSPLEKSEKESTVPEPIIIRQESVHESQTMTKGILKNPLSPPRPKEARRVQIHIEPESSDSEPDEPVLMK